MHYGVGSLSHLALLRIEHAYVNRADIEKVIVFIRKSSFQVPFPTDFYSKQRE